MAYVNMSDGNVYNDEDYDDDDDSECVFHSLCMTNWLQNIRTEISGYVHQLMGQKFA